VGLPITAVLGLLDAHPIAKAVTAGLLCFACSSQSPSPAGSAGSGGASGGTGPGGAGAAPGGAPSVGAGGAAGSAASSAVAGAATGSSGAPAAVGGAAGSAAGDAGSGGSSASAGSAGAAGSAAAPIIPVQVTGSDKYRFNFADTTLEIDAQTGARVSKLALGGADMIVTAATDPTTWGSVFWTSPRLKTWMPEWPPPAAVDNSPYQATLSGNHLLTVGTADASLAVSMSKDYAVDSASGWITINYTIHAAKELKAAPWEVSRVPRGGITFFPLGSSLTKGPLTVTQADGIVWFDDGTKSATSDDGSKLFADGASGYEAYALGGILFLKRFADQPATAQAPGEGEICIYPGATWLEFEVQGPYTQIAKDGTLPWKVEWKLLKIPSSVTVAVGSASLVAFVTQELAR
jgi:hypothetical protein